MNHAELLALLLPPVSYAPSGPALQTELAAEGQALDAALINAERAKGAVTPFFAEQLLPDWERVCGITPPPSAGYQQRLQAVLAKLAETGGLSIPYFVRLAAGMGYQITINEPQPFRAGVGRAGDTLWVPDILWVWQVVVHSNSSNVYRFRAGQSAAGERLAEFGDAVIEEVFNDLKPAHTFVYFAYQEA
ncbi:YmfQ family protein [Pseudogulbenkiania sp. MAI-1]|uniref:YmfQ family protein n=1 Tax=Pseudogulbenkiania sp. MAI-1 TaxID=990370 RepID=UPI00045E93E1|nr:putative phage tail protein [Pseudogulbenkiania sp. MAI-1]